MNTHMLTGILFLATTIFVATAIFFAIGKKSTRNDVRVIVFLALACASFVGLLINEFGLMGAR